MEADELLLAFFKAIVPKMNVPLEVSTDEFFPGCARADTPRADGGRYHRR